QMTYFVQPRAQCFVPSATPRPFKVWQAPRSKIGCLTSASGQKRTFEHVRAMSALPPIADIGTQSRDVRFVPIADIGPISHSITLSARPTREVTSKLATSIVDNSP